MIGQAKMSTPTKGALSMRGSILGHKVGRAKSIRERPSVLRTASFSYADCSAI